MITPVKKSDSKGNMNFSNYNYDLLDYSHDTNVQFGAIDPLFFNYLLIILQQINVLWK